MPVLKVRKNGVWVDAIGGASSANTLVVTITENADGTYSADKTFSEVYAAGHDVLAVMNFEDGHSHVFSVNGRASTMICFQSDFYGQSSMYVAFYSDGTIEMRDIKYAASLPEVTYDDDGAFLRVVNGEWAAVNIANAEEAGF